MHEPDTSESIKLFLAGDVMTGRGVDQILPHPCDPRIYETCAISALDYLRMAERRHGPVSRPVPFGYIWGEGLCELSRQQPDARLINLETAITRSETPADKRINYRMSPENVEPLRAAGIHARVLANNHVLDWGEQGCPSSKIFGQFSSRAYSAAADARALIRAGRPREPSMSELLTSA